VGARIKEFYPRPTSGSTQTTGGNVALIAASSVAAAGYPCRSVALKFAARLELYP